ncbi:MAG: acyltransferase family protein [Candidatus Heimdallarchaeota archaeon]
MTNREQITELVLDENKEMITDETRFFQVDFLKAVMIFLVIFDHIVSWNIKSNIGVALWERISIPVFLVIMGYNMGKSFQRKTVLTLRELYSWKYFKSKILRYIVPFLVLYAASTFIGLLMYGFDIKAMYQNQFSPSHGYMNLFIGILPFWGPGNWFIPVILQSIIIIPLIYWGFKRKPILTLILCFVVEIMMQLTVFFYIGDITSWQEIHILNMFMNSILFYLSAIGLGIWFSRDHELQSSRNFFMWLLYPISLAYIVTFQFFGFRYMIGNVPLLRGDYHFLVFPYSAFLFLIAMKFLPQRTKNKFFKAIAVIGKSTYHILLIQILGYGMITAYWGTHYSIDIGSGPYDIVDIIFAWVLFISFGILWYKIEKQRVLLRKIFYYINIFTVFPSILLFSFWAQGLWVPVELLIVIGYSIAALITRLIIRKPLDTRILGVWTIFLLTTFSMVVLQNQLFSPYEFWYTLIPISIALTLAIGMTLYYTLLKH